MRTRKDGHFDNFCKIVNSDYICIRMQTTIKPSTKEDLMQGQILQAAQHLFQKYGFQKVTMDDVARAIGKGRSSLYYYYKSKDEVFDAVIDAEIREIIAELGRAIDQATTVEEKFRDFCLTKIRIARKKSEFFHALESGMNADEMSQYARKKQAVTRRMMGEETGLLRELVVAGIKTKELPKMGSSAIDMAVFVMLNSLHGLKMGMLTGNDFSRLDDAVDVLTNMAMRAMGR
ncbi:MAG TPA: TetR/AcrR family transcriptional regulator [Puia sp.]|nr:TetR/AcrR family transcriptional regulator [Puia sp.]